MFGLLKHRPADPVNRIDFRKSYCGTCKTIGSMYGHKERLLLNFDVVFLSEILAEMSGNSNDFAAISINKCFSLPRHQHQIPDFLVYTASINMLLAGIKINDNITDSGFGTTAWRALAWMQKAKFQKARKILDGWGLLHQQVESIVKEHSRREKERLHLSDTAAACRYYSEMTGLLTGEIFRHAASTVKRPDAAENLYQIGKAYGEIVYLVDAINDYEKDLKHGSFNLLLIGTHKPTPSLLPETIDIVHGLIADKLLLIRKQIFLLPIPELKMHLFAERFQSSVTGALWKSNACFAAQTCRAPRMSISEKYLRTYGWAKHVLSPAKPQSFKLAGAAIAASFVALILLALPLRVDAIAPANPQQNQCWSDLGDECCQCCCDACCDSICNSRE